MQHTEDLPVEVRTARVGGFQTISAHVFSRDASARIELDAKPGSTREALRLLGRVALEVVVESRRVQGVHS